MNLTPADLAEEIRTSHSCPSADADVWAAAYWHQEFAYLLSEAAVLLAGRQEELITLIRTEGLTSPEFRMDTPVVPVRTVNVAALREELPAIFDRVVFLRATDAERLLSRRRLYESAVAEAGADRVRPLERVNLGDLAKVLPADEFSRYIVITEKPLPARIVRAAEAV